MYQVDAGLGTYKRAKRLDQKTNAITPFRPVVPQLVFFAMMTMLTTTPNTRGQKSKSVTKANHRKSNFAFFLGILMLLLGIPTIKSNRSLAFILLALALVLVGFATLISASTGISHLISSTVNFTLPYVTIFISTCYYR